MELKDWYELTKALVTIGTLIFTAIQALLLRKQMKKEHEKRRRENTVDVMYNWCNSLEKNTSLAVDVAQQLSSPQCQSKTIRLPHQIFHAILTLPCPT